MNNLPRSIVPVDLSAAMRDNMFKILVDSQIKSSVGEKGEALLKDTHLNLLRSDTNFSAIYNETIVNSAVNKLNIINQNRIIRIKQALSGNDQEALLSKFGGKFRLQFTSVDTGTHGFYRALRKILTEYIYEELDYKSYALKTSSGHLFLKDVGGNPLDTLYNKRCNTHICSPCLSLDDALRHSRVRHKLSTFTPLDKIQHKIYLDLMEQNPNRICSRKAQHCYHKSKFLVFIHSSYDCSLSDMADMMVSSSADVALGMFHVPKDNFCDLLEGNEPRGLYWKAHRRGGINYIKFWFDEDRQHVYIHRLDTYLGLIKNGVITSSCGSYKFAVTLDQNYFNVQLFRIYRLFDPMIPPSFTSIKFPFCRDDVTLIHYYGIAKDSLCGSHESLRPVLLKVPTVYYKRLYSYLLGCPDGRFTINNAITMAITLATRVCVNGVYFTFPKVDDNMNLGAIAHAVYFLVWKDKYDHSVVLKKMMDDEKLSRDGTRSFNNFFFNLFSREYRTFDETPVPVKNLHDFEQYMDKKLIDDESVRCRDSNAIYKYIKYVYDMFSYRKKFDAVAYPITKVVTIDQYVDLIYNDSVTSVVHVTNDLTSMFNEINETSSVEEFAYKPVTSLRCRNHDVPMKKLDVRITKDQCAFVSMAVAAGMHDYDVMKSHLLASVYLRESRGFSIPAIMKIKAVLMATDEPASMDILRLWSMHYSIPLCVHLGPHYQHYGEYDCPAFHFEISDSHCVPLVADLSKLLPQPEFVTVLLDGDDRKVGRNTYVDIFDHDSYESCKQLSRNALDSRKKELMPLYYPSAELGLESRYGLDLLYLDGLYDVIKHGRVLDMCSGPGSYIQVVHNKYPMNRITAISDEAKIPVKKHLLDDLEHYNFGTPGDIENKNVRDCVCGAMLNKNLMYDTCLFDGDVAIDDFQQRNAANYSLLLNAVKLMLRFTNQGGNWMLSVRCLFDPHFASILQLLQLCFSRVVFVKSAFSSPLSSVVHVLCFGFASPDYELAFAYLAMDYAEVKVSVSNYYDLICMQVASAQNNNMRMLVAGDKRAQSVMWPVFKIYFRVRKCSVPIYVEELPCPPVDSDQFISTRECDGSVHSTDVGISDENATTLLRIFANVHASNHVDVNFVSGRIGTVGSEIDRLIGTLPKFVRISYTFNSVPSFSDDYLYLPIVGHADMLDEFIRLAESHPVKLRFFYDTNILRHFPETEKKPVVDCINKHLELNIPETHVYLLVDRSGMPSPVGKYPVKYVAAFNEFSSYLKSVHEQHYLAHLSNWTSHVSNYLVHRRERNLQVMLNDKEYNYVLIKGSGNGYTVIASGHEVKPSYQHYFNGQHFLPLSNITLGEYGLLSDITVKYSFDRVCPVIESVKIDDDHILPKVCMYQGVAGFGKTTKIIQTCRPTMRCDRVKERLILTQTYEGKEDMLCRLSSHYMISKDDIDTKYVRTMNSYLSDPVKAREVYLDEAMMNHPGAVVAVAALSDAECIYGYGDLCQIPFNSKLPNCVFVFSNMDAVFPIVDIFNISYRCPVDVAAVLHDVYEERHALVGGVAVPMKSYSEERGSMRVVHIRSVDEVALEDGATYLTFTNNDKRALENRGIVASTIASFQGKQAKNVVIYRSSINVSDPIFNQISIVVTALTRHTHFLTYYTHLCNGHDELECRMSSTVTETDRLTYSAVERIGASTVGDDVYLVDKFMPDYRPTMDNRNDCGKVSYTTGVTEGADRLIVGNYGCELNGIRVDVRRKDEQYFVRSVSGLLEGNTLSVKKFFLSKFSLDPYMISRHLTKMNLPVKLEVQIDVEDAELSKYRRDVADGYSYQNVFCGASMSSPEGPDVDFPEFRRSNPIICGTVDILQTPLDAKFGASTSIDTSNDSYMVHSEDISYVVPNLTIDLNKDVLKYPVYDHFRPFLRSCAPDQREVTQRELVLATTKRNFNPPMMQDYVDDDSIVAEMMDKISFLFIQGYRDVLATMPPINVDRDLVMEWLCGQPESVAGALERDSNVFFSRLDVLKTGIKRTPKIDINSMDPMVYQALQTILYQEKHLNAFFCVLMRQLKDRMFSFLRPEFMVFTDCSPSVFSSILSSRFRPGSRNRIFLFSGDDSWISVNGSSVEIDISKFDKSQIYYVLLFECQYFALMGVPDEYVRMWFYAHYIRYVKDAGTGISYYNTPQRNSGDAWTFGGNTMFLMTVVACCIDMNDHTRIKYTPSFDKFRTMFNLDVKRKWYDTPYFCSKFLLKADDEYKFVPCPMKMLVKLGRKDVKNSDHLESYRLSLIDLTVDYSDVRIYDELSTAIMERYGIEFDSYVILSTIYSTVRSREHFVTLFSPDEHAVVDVLGRWNEND